MALLHSPGPGGQVAIFHRPGGLHIWAKVALGASGGDRGVGKVALRAPGRTRYLLLVVMHVAWIYVYVGLVCDG